LRNNWPWRRDAAEQSYAVVKQRNAQD